MLESFYFLNILRKSSKMYFFLHSSALSHQDLIFALLVPNWLFLTLATKLSGAKLSDAKLSDAKLSYNLLNQTQHFILQFL